MRQRRAARRGREIYSDRKRAPAARVLAHAFRDAWRGVVRHRAFSGFAIVILALGAGSATALVGLMDALLIRPPAHVNEPDRLVEVNGAVNFVSYGEVARRSRTLDVAAVSGPPGLTFTFGRDEAARPIRALCVTAGYFEVLGAVPIAGRAFLPDEDVRGGEPLTVLAYGLWQREFDGRPDVVGETTTIAGRSHRIVGVAPRDFRGLDVDRINAWLLMTATPDLCSFLGSDLLDDTRAAWLTTIGRLRPGVTLADAELDTRALSLHDIRGPGRRPASRELDVVLSDTAPGGDELLAISLAAGAILMLAIACANVAGLLSVRALQRRREIALRVQLGASRTRVFLHLFLENMLLTLACGVAALGLASLLTSALSVFFPLLARDAWFDSRGLIVLGGFTLGAGIVAGVVPSVQAARAHSGGLWRVGHDVGHRHALWRRALIVSQMALALVLVSSAGLFTHSLILATRDLGYDRDRVVMAPLDLQEAGVRGAPEIHAVFDEILARVRALPEVEAASLTTAAPLGSGLVAVVPRAPDARADALMQSLHSVSPDYFRTLGTRIVEGRPFTPEDHLGAPSVMIVDEDLARELWPGEDVVGLCKSVTSFMPCDTVVGISRPRRFGSLTRRQGELFKPMAQRPSQPPSTVFIRAAADVDALVPVIAATIQDVVPSLPFADVRPLADLVATRARSWRLGAALFGLFGGLAVVLAAVGLYASLAFTVRQRTPEIGVRIALGANPASVARLVMRQGLTLIAVGWLIGAGAVLAVANSIRSLLFGVQPADPATFVLASLVIVLAGFAGSALPALRAARVDPVVALRRD